VSSNLALKRLVILIGCLIAAGLTVVVAQAADRSPAQRAEEIHSTLLNVQLALPSDVAMAQQLAATAQQLYRGAWVAAIVEVSPQADQRIREGLQAAQAAVANRDVAQIAAARAQVWTGLLMGSYAVVEKALETNDVATAEAWLPLREFRTATRFSPPRSDATRAIANLNQGQLSSSDALLAVRADVWDTYQARLDQALEDVRITEQKGFATRVAENAALAEGYFQILAPAYAAQRGTEQARHAQQSFADLRQAAREHVSTAAALQSIELALQGFRAAPLSLAEQARRAGQLQRYLKLVPIEYGRGVQAGVVTSDLEIQEAKTFLQGAQAAFADLRHLLEKRDPQQTAQVASRFDRLQAMLEGTVTRTAPAAPEEVQRTTDDLLQLLTEISPAEWTQRNSEGDFDVIATLLDQMETAAKAGQYDVAEAARLEAYAILESGPEARLVAFAPQLKIRIEDLFWNGLGDYPGLARLITQHASPAAIKASRAALDGALTEAQALMGENTAPTAIAANAAIIVFREGLEAVLILASLLSSLKRAEERRYRKPLWLGAAAAGLATALTWVLANGVLVALGRLGERLEAIVSLIAVGVLLVITNWFFHKVYWTGWIAGFHARKKRLIKGEAGLWFGLILLGFTSVYREGFESVLFLQALVLEGGVGVVLLGVVVALLAVGLVGLITFKLQVNLPYKKMLIFTGILIGGVLLVMVGNTVHVMQVIGWLPIHPIGNITLPYWLGTWFGLYATWEGISLQFAAAAFVIGSYLLAERHTHTPQRRSSDHTGRQTSSITTADQLADSPSTARSDATALDTPKPVTTVTMSLDPLEHPQ